MLRSRTALPIVLAALALAPAALSGQSYRTFGVGIALPKSDLADRYDRGYTLRGQYGASSGRLDIHLQTGYTRLPGKDVTVADTTESVPALDIYHTGAGARLRIGGLWVGANAAYFFGDDDSGLGWFPEVGLGLGPLELVADYRVDGDFNWLAVRVAWGM